ncbi:MAG: type 1 periplasmic-binding domain-containing protein [Acidimicrobiales bacterium]
MSVDRSQMSQAEFETMLRRWLLKMGGRYLPVLAAILAIALLIVFVPTTQPASNSGVAAGTIGSGGTSLSASAGSAGSPAPAANSASSTAQGQTGSASGSATSGTSGGSVVSSGGAGSIGDVAKTGVHCGPGVRQFAWSDYAPACVPAFHGNNGGATGQGVTPSTITLTYRLANSSQQSAVDALAGSANINQTDLVADMQTYINYFNTQFELYGRKVVLKTYQGQGDYLEEDQGQNLGATQADAVTAHDLGAFGDVTFALEASEPYEQDLAQEHVVSFSSVGMPQSFYQQFAPYEYSVEGPSGTVGLQEASAVICDRLAGMPAIFAGDVTYHSQNRKFGIIYPQTPYYQEAVNTAMTRLAACGVKPKVIGYSINVSEYEQEAVTSVAEMKAAGVTTLLCACDPIYPILLTQAASQQNWYPEWFAISYGDPASRNYTQSEWSHSVAGGVQFPTPSTTQAYQAYQLANPGHQPAETPPSSPPYYYVAYYELMEVFAGLQAAGPDLTAASFERGEFSLPASIPGDPVGGRWIYGQNVFDPVASFSMVWWDPNAVSKFDGSKGAYQWCNGGQTYLVSDLAALGSHRQLHCFGR